MRLVPLVLLLLVTSLANAQDKRSLDHTSYELWKAISDQQLSRDGEWAVWREAPDTVGDGYVLVRSVDGRTTYRIERGDDPKFLADGSYVLAMVRAPYDSTRQAKIDGRKGDKMPADSVAILNLANGTLVVRGPAKSFAVPDESGSVAAILYGKEASDEPEADDGDEAQEGEEGREGETSSDDNNPAEHDKQEGTRLEIFRLDSSDDFRESFGDVTDYRFTDDGSWLVYTAESKDGTADGVFAVDANEYNVTPLMTGVGNYAKLTLDESGTAAAFISNFANFASDQPEYAVYSGSLGNSAGIIVAPDNAGLPDGWWISEHANLRFSDFGDRIFFGSAPKPEPESDEVIPDDEKVEVDIWNWNEPVLQTVQLYRLQQDMRRSYLAVAHLGDTPVVQLASPAMPQVAIGDTGDMNTLMGSSNVPYSVDNDWQTPNRTDYYAVDIDTGNHRRILEGVQARASLSPSGDRLAWWDGYDKVWKLTTWSTGPETVVTRDATANLGVAFHNELHDSPAIPGSYGEAGWSGDTYIVYDRTDIWALPPDGRPRNLTGGKGAADGLRYRIVDLDRDVPTVDLSAPLMLSVFDLSTKAAGFARLDDGDIQPLIIEDRRFSSPIKSEDADRLLFTRQSFTEFGDLWTSRSSLQNPTRLSDANPQQSEYLWGTAELTSWTSTDGDRLEGILYKPDNFDPGTKYPMIVYFYERATDGLHTYTTINPGRSVITRSFYTSRGYVVFVPDIPYKEGYPGESAMNAVMPGVSKLIDAGFVDRDRIGVQGHSWGGYQIAYMVTRTNLFRAAAGGAPVSNMISAYGGIRWGTGLSRQFQYEYTQSRIAGTLWEKPLRYIENSPIFWADKVETPLLMLHNDHDGAVPWYQGIEMFMALRRLDKPSWLINYNGEPHWPLPYWKRVDWQIRLQQYFDHYLIDAPAPVWMTDGVPAVKKGRTMGLELPATDRN